MLRYAILEERFDVRQDIELLRRDVSELKVEAATVKSEIKRLDETIHAEIKRLDDKIDSLKSTLNLHLMLILLLFGTLISGFIKLIFFP